MNKNISKHKEFIEREISRINNSEELNSVIKYHKQMTLNFQMERLIHLLVTFFFAILSILFITIFSLTNLQILAVVGLLTTLLLVPYISHYYKLENGVQSLYKLDKKLLEKKINLQRSNL